MSCVMARSAVAAAVVALLAHSVAAGQASHAVPGFKYVGCVRAGKDVFPLAMNFFGSFTPEECQEACPRSQQMDVWAALGDGCWCTQPGANSVAPAYELVDENYCSKQCVRDKDSAGHCGGPGDTDPMIYNLYSGRRDDNAGLPLSVNTEPWPEVSSSDQFSVLPSETDLFPLITWTTEVLPFTFPVPVSAPSPDIFSLSDEVLSVTMVVPEVSGLGKFTATASDQSVETLASSCSSSTTESLPASQGRPPFHSPPLTAPLPIPVSETPAAQQSGAGAATGVTTPSSCLPTITTTQTIYRTLSRTIAGSGGLPPASASGPPPFYPTSSCNTTSSPGSSSESSTEATLSGSASTTAAATWPTVLTVEPISGEAGATLGTEGTSTASTLSTRSRSAGAGGTGAAQPVPVSGAFRASGDGFLAVAVGALLALL